jgi:hypothetical protein
LSTDSRSGSRATGQRGTGRLLRERADLGPNAQIIDRAECMLAHESMPIDQDEAGRDLGTAYCVPEAGIDYKRQMRAQISGEEFLRIPRR